MKNTNENTTTNNCGKCAGTGSLHALSCPIELSRPVAPRPVRPARRTRAELLADGLRDLYGTNPNDGYVNDEDGCWDSDNSDDCDEVY